METYQTLCKSTEKTAVALGFFDGIHIGHRAVISGAVAEKQNGLNPAALTFLQRPAAIISNLAQENLLSSEEKNRQLAACGIEKIFNINFSDIAQMSPKEFVFGVLRDTLNAKKVFCGYNYRFGKNASGNVQTLSKLCEKIDCEVSSAPPVLHNGIAVSSTEIRQMIKTGEIEEANKLLFKPFSVSGVVIEGNKIGRTIGFPTLNLIPPANIVLPKFGVYAATALLRGKNYTAVANIGERPTVGGSVVLYEAWLPNFSGPDFYGEEVRLKLRKFIRPEKKFSTLQELQGAINNDAEIILNF